MTKRPPGLRIATHARIQPTSEAALVSPAKTCARARAAVGRDANRARFEERRIGDDQIGLSVGEPRRASRACIAHVEPQDSRALGHSVAFGITGGQGCKIGVHLDEVGAGVWAAAENGKRDRADPRADIRETTVRKIGRCGEQRRVGSRPMAAAGLDEGQAAAEPGVAGRLLPLRCGAEAVHRLSHCAVRLRVQHP